MARPTLLSAVVVPPALHPSHHCLDLRGRVFGRLTVLRFVQVKNGQSFWLCRCTCGATKEIKGNNLTSGHTKSCGCLRREVCKQHLASLNTTHGESRHGKVSLEYRTWEAMLSRCFNKYHRRYKDWGGRGITVCAEWRGPDGFKNFLAYMGRKLPGLTLERLDNDGNYTPDNCCWATAKSQNRNKRPRTKGQQARAAKSRHQKGATQ
jgi:hypothetical protein